MIGTLYEWLPAGFISMVSKPLPNRFGIYNGVAVRDVPFFRERDYQPHKKDRLWQATAATVSPDDHVTFIGGGKGIVPVKTARLACDVTVIEGAKTLALELERTAGWNGVDLDVIHGIAGSPEHVWGDYRDAERIPPAAISGDVLVLDCEGAERDILPLPDKKIVLETHPMHGVSESTARELLHGKITSYGRNAHGGKILVQE